MGEAEEGAGGGGFQGCVQWDRERGVVTGGGFSGQGLWGEPGQRLGDSMGGFWRTGTGVTGHKRTRRRSWGQFAVPKSFQLCVVQLSKLG